MVHSVPLKKQPMPQKKSENNQRPIENDKHLDINEVSSKPEETLQGAMITAGGQVMLGRGLYSSEKSKILQSPENPKV